MLAVVCLTVQKTGICIVHFRRNDVQLKPESMFKLAGMSVQVNRNQRSTKTGMGVQVDPEYTVLRKTKQKEAHVNNNILGKTSHLKSAVAALKSSDGLPFQSSLSRKEIINAISEIYYRDRYNFFPPEVTVWLFLSQKLENK